MTFYVHIYYIGTYITINENEIVPSTIVLNDTRYWSSTRSIHVVVVYIQYFLSCEHRILSASPSVLLIGIFFFLR